MVAILAQVLFSFSGRGGGSAMARVGSLPSASPDRDLELRCMVIVSSAFVS